MAEWTDRLRRLKSARFREVGRVLLSVQDELNKRHAFVGLKDTIRTANDLIRNGLVTSPEAAIILEAMEDAAEERSSPPERNLIDWLLEEESEYREHSTPPSGCTIEVLLRSLCDEFAVSGEWYDRHVMAMMMLGTGEPEDRAPLAPGEGKGLLGRGGNPPPSRYFTERRIAERKVNDQPPELYHRTEPDRAAAILRSGHLRGPLSTSENPAFLKPGPVIFVIDARKSMKLGFKLMPYLWGPTYLRKAEWVIADRHAEYYGGHAVIHSRPIRIPLSVVTQIGMMRRCLESEEGQGIKRFAEKLRIPVVQWEWERHWPHGLED